MLTPDRRGLLMGGMQNWDTISHNCEDFKWFTQMSIPRELSVRDGRLYQKPITELEDLRKNKVVYEDVVIDNTTISLEHVEGRVLDM